MYKSIFKRLLDIVLALLGIIVLSPLFIITAIAIKLDSTGPIIFRQKRLGLHGKEFEMYKFRSMCLNAENGGVYSGKNDIRVTKIGKMIRATSIDELPQFLNILFGDMSIIGPRPPLTYHPWPFEQYTNEQKQMFDVRPGVTGYAQISGRKEVEWTKRIKLNVWYVQNMSFFLDLKIFIITIFKVVAMKDNYNSSRTSN